MAIRSLLSSSFLRSSFSFPSSLSSLSVSSQYRPQGSRFSSGLVDPLVDLTDEEIAVYEMAKNFADKEMSPHAREWDERETFPRDVLKTLASLGFGGIYARTEYGGGGMRRVDAAIIFEALSSACVSTTAFLSIHNMAVWMIDTFGSKELRAKYVPSLSSMDAMASYCLTEPSAGSDAVSLRTSAVRKGDKYILNGEKAFISGGGDSDVYVVMCRTGGEGAKGISCLVVDKASPGLSFGKKESKLGWNSQPTRAVIFQDCVVDVSNRIGEEGEGFKFAMQGIDGGRVNIAACSLGGAQTCFDLARDYVKVRKQFGHPLSSLQATQFTLAEMAADLVASRYLVRSAARMIDKAHTQRSAYCAMAKFFATEKCYQICDNALQLHGGYGYLKDYPIQRYLRDLRVHRILEGTNQIMRIVTARGL